MPWKVAVLRQRRAARYHKRKALYGALPYNSVVWCCAVNKDFLVVVVNDAAHVRRATVTYFQVILVKDGVVIVVWWEVFLDRVEEGFGDVGLNLFAVWGWGVKPPVVSISISISTLLKPSKQVTSNKELN